MAKGPASAGRPEAPGGERTLHSPRQHVTCWLNRSTSHTAWLALWQELSPTLQALFQLAVSWSSTCMSERRSRLFSVP